MDTDRPNTTDTARTGTGHTAHAAARTRSRDAAPRPWTPPTLQALPRLTDLTLVSGDPIGGEGNTGGGGSTVF